MIKTNTLYLLCRFNLFVMKRLIVFGIFFIALIAVSSCKKEIIKPCESIETGENGDRVAPKNINIGGSNVGNGSNASTSEGAGGINGDITDPNDDDYTRKPRKKN